MRKYIILYIICLIGSYGFTKAQSLANRIGVCTSPNNALILKNAGCTYIEVSISSFLIPDKSDSEFAKNRQVAKDTVLPIYSGNGFFPKNYRLTGPDVQMDKLISYGRNAVNRANELGMKVLVLGSGAARNIPEGFSREEAKKQFTALCSELAKIADSTNVVIVIEPLQSSESNFINTVSEGAEIARKVNNPHLGVLADFYHMMRENEDPIDIVKAKKWLKHCHIAEKEVRSAPGVKGDDFTPFFKALKKIGYKGNISIECGWNNLEQQLPKAVETIQKQIRSIEK